MKDRYFKSSFSWVLLHKKTGTDGSIYKASHFIFSILKSKTTILTRSQRLLRIELGDIDLMKLVSDRCGFDWDFCHEGFMSMWLFLLFSNNLYDFVLGDVDLVFHVLK
jgi:hypothetical protein